MPRPLEVVSSDNHTHIPLPRDRNTLQVQADVSPNLYLAFRMSALAMLAINLIENGGRLPTVQVWFENQTASAPKQHWFVGTLVDVDETTGFLEFSDGTRLNTNLLLRVTF